MFNRRFLAILVPSLFLGAAILFGARSAEQETPSRPVVGQPRAVRTGVVESTASHREVRIAGVTRASRRASLAFTLPARVASRQVEIGDRVAAGQQLARLDDREFVLAERTAAAGVAELAARLAQARRDEERVARLFSGRAATAEELEHSRATTAALAAARDAASARHADTRRLLRDVTLTAPFDGTVTAVSVEAGEWASPGSKVVEIAGRGAVEVQVELPESIRMRLATGSPVRVEVASLGRTIAGRVTHVADASSGGGRLFPALIRLDSDAQLIAGLAAEVVLEVAEPAALTVPLAAVIDSGSSRPSLFRIAGNRAQRIAIEPGRVIGDRLTLKSSELRAGDRIAIVGHTALVDGDAVEVR